MSERGFTLTELTIALTVLSILMSISFPMGKMMMASYRIDGMIQEMKALATQAELCRLMPGGNTYTNVRSTTIANKLASQNINQLKLSLSSDKLNHWGSPFLFTTTGNSVTVSTVVPFTNISPFEAKATPNGSSTILTVHYSPTTMNTNPLANSLANKKIMYLE